MFEKIKKALKLKRKPSPIAREVFDLVFDTPIGARNRFDPNGDHAHHIEDKEFSFVELGPITPEPLSMHEAVSNKGAKAVAGNLRKRKPAHLKVAANIVKNPSTDLEEAAHDYEFCFSQLYDYVDMFFVNLSQEEVPGAKQLQEISLLSETVDRLLNLRLYFNDYKPILIQVSSDLPRTDLDEIIRYSRGSGVDGLVSDSLEIIKYVYATTNGRLPVISKVEFKTPQEAIDILDAGATLIETHSQFKGLALRKSLLKIYSNNKEQK